MTVNRYIINGICADGEQAKAFWLTKVKRFIGSQRLNKWTCTRDITCTCLALDLTITARAGHFTDSVSVRKNLAAVEKNNEWIAQNHIAVFSKRSYHILHAYIPFLLMLKTTF